MPLKAVNSKRVTEDSEYPSISEMDVEIGEVIGKGNSGDVFKGSAFGTVIALKAITNPKVQEEFERESSILKFEMKNTLITCRKLRHKNILRFFGIYRNEKGVFMMTEYMKDGSLLDYIRKNGATVDIRSLRNM